MDGPAIYVRRRAVVAAMQLTTDNPDALIKWRGCGSIWTSNDGEIQVRIPDCQEVRAGDFLVQEQDGSLETLTAESFGKRYMDREQLALVYP